MGRLNIVEDDDDNKSVAVVKTSNVVEVSASKSGKDHSDVARKKCISDESGYFEGTEEFLPGESGSIEILFEKSSAGNNNLKHVRLPVPSPVGSVCHNVLQVPEPMTSRPQPDQVPSTSKGKSNHEKHVLKTILNYEKGSLK